MTPKDAEIILSAEVPIFVQLVELQGAPLRSVDPEDIYASLRTTAITQAMLLFYEVTTAPTPMLERHERAKSDQ